VVGLAGCGKVAAQQPSDAAADAAPDAALVCDPTAPLGPPMLLPGFASTTANEFGARLSPDELTIYVVANVPGGKGGHDLYMAQRSSLHEPFGALMPLTALNSTAEEYDPSVSADGLTLVFASNRVTGEGFHLYVSTRRSTLSVFEQPSLLSGVAAPTATNNDLEPFLTADGKELWFASDRSSNYDLYRAAWIGSGFANPQVVGELNTSANELDPTLSADRLTVYFSRAGQSIDIWTAHRTTVVDGFPTPTPVPVLDTTADDRPNWLSPDNCRLYLMSTITTTWDVYIATRQPQ